MPRPRRREFPAPLTRPLGSTPGSATPPVQAGTPPATPGPTILQPPAEPYYDDDGVEYGAYAPRQESLLRNPYVLAALAIAGAILMAIVVVALSSGGGSGGGSGVGAVATADPRTPQAGGVLIEAISTSTVREGPGTDYSQVGTLARGQKVSVTGKDAGGKWFQIIFPQNSTLRGWVPASALKVSDINIPGLAVVAVTPIARPTEVPPTAAPQPTEEATTTPTATGTVTPGPDLAVSIVGNNCTPGAKVSVAVRNVGQAAVSGRGLQVIVSVAGEVRSTQVIAIGTLQPGDSITIPTDEVVTAPRTSVTADLQGSPQDVNKGNNTAECVVQGAVTPSPVTTAPLPPTPTRTPTSVTTP